MLSNKNENSHIQLVVVCSCVGERKRNLVKQQEKIMRVFAFNYEKIIVNYEKMRGNDNYICCMILMTYSRCKVNERYGKNRRLILIMNFVAILRLIYSA